MERKSEMGAYGENSNVQNSGNYITIIPVDYSRRGYPIQAEYQYNEFRSREEYYSVQSQKLQAEVNAHLYSVSQRLPHLSYSPLGRHNEWDKHDPHKPLQPDSKESNSSDSLEKSVMGSNLSSCSNQTGSSSIAAGSFSTTEPITSGGSSSSAISPPLPGSSGSTASSSSVSSSPVTCVYLMSRTAIMVEMSSEEIPGNVTAARFLNAVLATEEMGLIQPSTRSLAANVFSLWMCSPLLDPAKATPLSVADLGQLAEVAAALRARFESRRARDQPVLRLQRNVFFPKHLEEGIKDSKIQELLYEEARYNVVNGRYPLETAQALMLGGIQARVQLGPYDPHRHTAKFFRENQDKYLPQHARSGRWAALLPAGRKGSPEARLLEQAQRPAAAPPRKLRHKYLAHTRMLPTYGAAFFQGQIEQPVRSLTSLLTHEDIPVLVAVNSNGVYVIDDTESTVLLGLLYEELSWDIGLPSEDNEDCLPCLFLQFMVVENGLRVSKILQVFSKQAVMMDTLIEYFAGEYRKRLGHETPSDHANYDYHSEHQFITDSGSISLPPLSRPDSPQRRLANKLSRLALATHDGRGHLLGGAGDWNTDLDRPQPSWILPKH